MKRTPYRAVNHVLAASFHCRQTSAMSMDRGVSVRCTPLQRLWRYMCALLVLACTGLGIASPAFAESAATSGTTQAVVVGPLSFFKVEDLVFGSIIPSATAGTVVVSPNGSRTKTGGVTLATGAAPHPARFAGMGARNQIVTIRMVSNSATLTRVGGGGTMTIDTFIIGSTPTAQLTTAPTSFRIGSTTGMFQFPLGATLRVKANQEPGVYTGTFAVTVQYQ